MKGLILIGEPGSGKSTIAQVLCEKLQWKKASFAGPLKDEVAQALRFTYGANSMPNFRSEMDDPKVKDNYRGILQWWGTEWRRGQDPNYWVTQLVQSLSQSESYVIDDCRFNNEHEALGLLGFKTVLLAPGETTRPVQAHASEVDWKTWTPDLTLSWERGPEHQADRIIEALGLGKTVNAAT